MNHTRGSKRRTALVKLLAGVVVALPGAYSAVKTQYAADSDKVRATVSIDRRVSDEVFDELTKNVEANTSDLKVLERTCVSHRDLFDLVTRLRRLSTVPRSPRRRREASEREAALERQLTTLKAKQAAALEAVAGARAKPRSRPKIRSSRDIRIQVRKKSSIPTF